MEGKENNLVDTALDRRSVLLEDSGGECVNAEEMKPVETFYEKYEREAKEREDASKLELLAMLDASPNIKSIEVEYDGSGDEGFIEEVTCLDAAGSPVEVDKELSALVEELVDELLPSGWGNDAGSYGACTIHVESGTMSFDHWERYEDANNESFEVELRGE